jgi:hypothetical protein
VRYIEIKGRRPEDAGAVILTKPGWEVTRCLQDEHWLYAVRLDDGVLWMI